MSRRTREQKYSGDRGEKNQGGSRIFWILDKICSICIFLIFIFGCTLVVKKVFIPVISMYRDAKETVDQSDESTFKTGQPSVVYDVDGNELKKLKGEKEVSYLTYDQLPEAAKLAIISVEDKNFASHRGIDIEGITRSALSLLVNRKITMGGSTITQQLSRNIFLNFDQTYSRKIKEIFISIAMEEKYSKQQILEYYLNNVYFANGYYGIEAASQAYFHKSSVDLTVSQVAFLCAIPNSPSNYDPYEHPKATMKRRDKILKNMYDDGYIDKEQYQKSINEDIEILPKTETATNDYAQTYILKCATESLMQAQGFEFKNTFSSDSEEEAYNEEYDELYNTCRQSLYNNGYKIYTSIDTEMQEQLQEAVSERLAEYFTDKTDDGIYEVQGAAVCIDNDTGKVAAIVGGREQDQEGYGLNRAYQSYRQPGSAIKPLLVYAPAFQKGYTPDSIVDDSEMTGKDAVSNAGSYSGSISIRQAVEKSSNVATYRLYESLGTDSCMEYLEKLGFSGLEQDDYEYKTTCLGGFTKGTTPLEMAAGYAALANDGTYRRPTCILSIEDSDGNEIVGSEDVETKSVYSSTSARMMTSVLESCVTEYGATATVCQLDTDIPVACKTGTTTDCVDGWLCGYSPYYTTAVWVGKDLYKAVDDLKGNTYPAEIWTSFMNTIHQNLERDYSLEEEFGAYIEGATTQNYQNTSSYEEEEEDDEDEYEESDQEDYVEDEDQSIDLDNDVQDEENQEDEESAAEEVPAEDGDTDEGENQEDSEEGQENDGGTDGETILQEEIPETE